MYRVTVDGRILESSVHGRFKEYHEERILVGDRVPLRNHEDGSVTIAELLPPRSVLTRRTPGRRRGERVVAVNIDQVIVVGSARQPDWDPHLIDRCVAGANGLHSTVVVNK